MNSERRVSNQSHFNVVDKSCNSRPKPSPKTVADQFVHQFYVVMSSCPRYLHRFYSSASTLTINETMENGSQDVLTAVTQEEIEETLSSFFVDARVRLEVVCPQDSTGDGIVVLVTGELVRRGKPDCTFAQSFFLAVQKKGFFVLNDILRILPLHRTENSASVDTRHCKKNDAFVNEGEAKQGSTEPLPTPQTPVRVDCSASLPAESKTAGAFLKEIRHVDKSEASAPSIASTRAAGGGDDNHSRFSPGRQQDKSPDPLEDDDLAGHSETGPTVQRTSSIFVRAIPDDIDEQALLQAFRQYGQVREGGVTIKQGRRDRFAFVDFDSANVDAVLDGRVKIYVQGQPVTVEEKRPIVIRRPARVKKTLTWHSRNPRDCSVSASGTYNRIEHPHFFHHDHLPQQPPVYTTPI